MAPTESTPDADEERVVRLRRVGQTKFVGTGSVSNRSVGGTRTPEYAPELGKWVGRPGLDPGTLGLTVLVRALQRLASRFTVSQNCR